MIKIYDKNDTFIAELKYDEEFYSNYAKHSHDMLSLTAIKSGEIDIEFHSYKSEVLKEKHIAVFNPHQVHKSTNKSKNTYGYFVLYFDEAWCIKLQNQIFDNQNTFYPIHINIIEDKEQNKTFLKLCEDILKSKNPYTQIEKFMLDIFKNYAKEDTRISKNSLAKEVKEYILNTSEQISLDDIAKKFSYSKEHIIRSFKKEFGLSPHAFLLDSKVKKAKKDLNTNYEINLSDIALEHGFYDQSHFSKNFKKVYATNPNAYKLDK